MQSKAKEIKLVIPAPNIKSMEATIVGTTPIIYNRFSHKAVMQMEEKQSGVIKPKKRDPRNPQQEYLDSFYRDSQGFISWPVLNIKQAMVDSARNVQGVTMTLLRGAVWIVGDLEGNIPMLSKGKPFKVTDKPKLIDSEDSPATGIIGYDPDDKNVAMRRDVVRLAGIDRPADLRYRGTVLDWSLKFLIKYNEDVIRPEWVFNLIQISGFACGLGEWRTEKNGFSGNYELKQ